MYRGHKSQFFPKNPEKYAGDETNIICRSTWERMLCHNLDENSAVKQWHSEETIVPYLSPIDNKVHRYYLDFTVEFKNGQTVLIEVKPSAQAQPKPPTVPKRKTKKAMHRFTIETRTWLINQAKWAAAKAVAERNGASFQVFTEHELRKLGCPV